MALLLGGGAPQETGRRLKKWVYQVPLKGRNSTSPVLHEWGKTLALIFEEASRLGAPLHSLLKEFLPLVKFEERLWSKTKSLEKQFGFQGAVVLVLPWAVIGIAGFKFSLNLFMIAGFLMQFIGLGLFYILIRFAVLETESEKKWIFNFLVFIWIRVLSGFTLKNAISSTLNSESVSVADHRSSKIVRRCSENWRAWLRAQETGALDAGFTWPKNLVYSSECASFLSKLIQTGAPSAQVLSHWVSRMSEEKQFDCEERVSMLPSKLSLVFCTFFTPALFLILMGGLWPQVNGLL